MSEWVILEDTTIETAQKMNKVYDNSYNRYLFAMTLPIGASIEATKNTVILGSYCLYYRQVKADTVYTQHLFVDTERLNNNEILTRDGIMRALSGTGDALNERIRVFMSANWVPRIAMDFEIPVSTRLQVWAK